MAGYIGSKAVLLSTTAATVTGDMTVDTNTLKVDSSNNRVGIGTASPSHPFHLVTSTNGTGVSGDDTWAAIIQNAEATDGRSYGLKIMAGSTTDQALGITDHDGSNDLMAVDGYGHVTMPKQPAFLAVSDTNQNDMAVNGLVQIAFGGERFDQNGDFASNTFTAPVTGRYMFSYFLNLRNMDADADYYLIRLSTSNKSYDLHKDYGFSSYDTVLWGQSASIMVDMDASDTAKIQFYQANGTAQTDLTGGEACFSGYLVC